jgi:DNA-binding HxlR family transcriptional regulator
MLPSEYDSQDCSIARSLEVLGERWTLLVVREALLGTTRYDEFLERLGAPTNTLAKRLVHLVDLGVLEKQPYRNGRQRYEYVLTEKGRALGTVVESLREWGDEHLSEGHPPVQVRHSSCGGEVEVELRCKKCGDRLRAGDLVHRHRVRRDKNPKLAPAA